MEHDNACEAAGGGISKAVDAHIEAVLREVESELDVIPTERRDEFLTEMRAHLYAMLQARLTDGLSESVAWQNTHRSFGEGREIGRALAHEWMQKPRIEIEGKPLSRRQKLSLILKPLVAGIVIFPTIHFIQPILNTYNLQGAFLFGLAVLLSAIFWKSSRKEGTSIPSTAVPIMVLMCLHFAVTGVFFIYSAQVQSPVFTYAFIGWNLLFTVVCLGLSVQHWRRVNAVRPWRQSVGYKENPIAAEETYRLSPWVGITLAILSIGSTAFFSNSGFFSMGSSFAIVGIILGIGAVMIRLLR